jgi:hypothetical protein
MLLLQLLLQLTLPFLLLLPLAAGWLGRQRRELVLLLKRRRSVCLGMLLLPSSVCWQCAVGAC